MIVIIVCNLGSFIVRFYFIFSLYLFSFDLKALLYVSVVDGLTKTNKTVPQYNTVYACSCVKGLCRSKSGGIEKFWASINFQPNCRKMMWGKKLKFWQSSKILSSFTWNPAGMYIIYTVSIYLKRWKGNKKYRKWLGGLDACLLVFGRVSSCLSFLFSFNITFLSFLNQKMDGWW